MTPIVVRRWRLDADRMLKIMELILVVINPQSADQSFTTSHRFGEAAGLIGRGDQCVWRLPDPSRHLSSQHALITVEDETFYLEDHSPNGVFVNGSDQPLGKGRRHPIADGDEYQLGPFRVLARLWNEQSPVLSLPESIAEFFDELETSMPAFGHDELAEQLSTRSAEAEESPYIPAETQEQDDLSWALDSVDVPNLLPLSPINGASTPINGASNGVSPELTLDVVEEQSPLGQRLYPNSIPEAAVSAQQVLTNTNEPRAESALGTWPKGGETEALAAFAASSGIDLSKLSQDEMVAVMAGCGALMRDSIKGLMELLARRSEQKSRFHLGLTLIQRRENNPLKYSVNEVQAIKQLVLDPQPECLAAPQAI